MTPVPHRDSPPRQRLSLRAVLVTATFLLLMPASVGQFCGDCNQDGTGPTILDALEAAQLATGVHAAVGSQSCLCDVDRTSSLSILDALIMAQHAAGLTVALQCPGWTRAAVTLQPSPRYSHAMTYDPVRQETVLFGGLDGSGPLADTWVYRPHTGWALRSPAVRPPATGRHGMLFDASIGKVVIVGGSLGSTWLWDGTNWEQFTTGTQVSSRNDPAVSYDPAGGFGILYGGATSPYLDDEWHWIYPTGWALVNGAVTGNGRRTQMAWCYSLGRAVFFGGVLDGGGVPTNETWEYAGTSWVPASPTVSPLARTDMDIVELPLPAGGALVYGGADGSGGYFADTWLYDGSTWVPAQTCVAPAARYAHQLAYDATQSAVVMFGGQTAMTTLDETWEYRLP